MASKISFFEYTLPVAHSRAIDSKFAARRAFYLVGITGEQLSLMRVFNPEGVARAHWVAIKNDEVVGLLPVFTGEKAFSLDANNRYEKISMWDILFYDDSFYQVFYDKEHDNMFLRTFLLFAHEDIVRKACRVCGYDVEQVVPVKLIEPGSKKAVGNCWKIICKNSEYDFHLLFMDLREGMQFDKKQLAHLEYCPMNLCETFVSFDTEYVLKMNAQGRLVLLSR